MKKQEMNEKQEIRLIVILAGCLISLLLAGCQEQVQTKQWGQGETPISYQEFFGNDNNARLDYVQTQHIDRTTQAIFDPNGIITYIIELEAATRTLKELTTILAEQVGESIRLNSAQHKKLGETDIRFHERILALERANENLCELIVPHCAVCEPEPTLTLEITATDECPNGYDIIWQLISCNAHFDIEATDPNETE
jgi:hypothetical protein